MAARWAIVCALLFGGRAAHADRRPVAVVNLSDEHATRELATQLEAELSVHPDLRGLPSTEAGALKDEIVDDDKPLLDQARRQLQSAEDAVNDDPARAVRDALEGHRQLWQVSPPRAVKLYADLTLALGQAQLNQRNHKEARAAFAHVHKLDPNRKLDGMIYLPEVVAAFDEARNAVAASGTIEVKGSGRVAIDGADVGVAPGTFTASAGAHVVWLTGPARDTRGTSLVVIPGAPVIADIPDAEATRSTKLQRARLALARAPDASARSAAMRHVAELVEVHDAVLLSMSNNKVIVQTWRDREPGFSALRERGTDKPIDLLAPLAPPKLIKHEEPPIKLPPLVVKRWYQQTRWRLGIAATITAAIVGGIVWANVGPGTFSIPGDVSVVTRPPAVLGR
jgi:hypothetical protein